MIQSTLDPAQIEALRNGDWVGPDPLGREPGQALWPGKYSRSAMSRIKATVGQYEFDALYQQHPQRTEGSLIKAYDIIQIRVDQLPLNLSLVRYWDLAVSGKRRADYITGALVGKSSDGKLYIIHIARLPGPWADARPDMVKVMLSDPASVVQGIEVAGQQAGYYQEFARDPKLTGRSIVPVEPKTVGNKEVRAQVWSSRIQDSLVHMVVGNGWNVDAFISECVAFPLGQHDDQVDSVSGGVQMLGSGSGWAAWAKKKLKESKA